MLKNIRIQNFRLCKDTVVGDMGRVVALVGRNGAGKSNILQAISIAARSATTPDTWRYIAPDPRTRTVISLELELPSGRFRYEASTEMKQTPTPKVSISELIERHDGQGWKVYIERAGEEVRISGRPPFKIGEASPCLSAIATLLPADDGVVTEVKPIITFLAAIHYYPLDEPVMNEAEQGFQLIAKKDYTKWLSTYESTGIAGDSIESVLLRILDMSLRKPDDLRVLKELVGPNSLGLIDDVRVVNYGNLGRQSSTAAQQEAENYYGIWFSPSRGLDTVPVIVPYSSLSVGTRRVIRMFSVMLFDASSVMLLEQPEDSLHQGMTKKLIGLLRENVDSQLIMSSHSSALLNKLRPEDIQLVSLHDGFTVARRLTNEERENATAFMNEEGPLYDFIVSLPEE
jgi:energy-coupling factor transporter ATP-binding protein EcfA2